MYSRGSIVYEKKKNNFALGYEMGRKGQKCRKFLLLDRLLKVTESTLQYLLQVKFRKFLKGTRTRSDQVIKLLNQLSKLWRVLDPQSEVSHNA